MDKIGEKIEKYVKERTGRIVIMIISIIVSMLAFDGIDTNMYQFKEVADVIRSMFVIFNLGLFGYLFKD